MVKVVDIRAIWLGFSVKEEENKLNNQVFKYIQVRRPKRVELPVD